MLNTGYNPRYISADYHQYFECPREYERWNKLEKEIIGIIFGVWMPDTDFNNNLIKDNTNEYLDKIGEGKLRQLLSDKGI